MLLSFSFNNFILKKCCQPQVGSLDICLEILLVSEIQSRRKYIPPVSKDPFPKKASLMVLHCLNMIVAQGQVLE